MKPVLLRMLQSVLFIVITAWLALVILIYFFQARLVFYPYRDLGQTPADIKLDYEELSLQGRTPLRFMAGGCQSKMPGPPCCFCMATRAISRTGWTASKSFMIWACPR